MISNIKRNAAPLLLLTLSVPALAQPETPPETAPPATTDAPPAAPAPAAPATDAAKPPKEPVLKAGEVRLDGKLVGITGKNAFVMQAISYSTPSGKTIEFEEVKRKVVKVATDASLHARGNGSRRYAFADLKLGGRVAVIGKNDANGALIAREVVLLDVSDIRMARTVIVSPAVGLLTREAMEARKSGQLERAVRLYTSAIGVAQQSNDGQGLSLALNNLGTVYSEMNDPAKALQVYTRALNNNRSMNDVEGQGLVLSNIGGVLEGTGREGEAFKTYERSLGLLRQTENRMSMLGVLDRLGTLLISKRLDPQVAPATAPADGAANPDAAMAAPGAMNGADAPPTDAATPSTDAAPDDPQRALTYFEQGVTLAHSLNERGSEADLLTSVALTSLFLGDTARANQAIEGATNLLPSVTDKPERANLLASLGRYYEQASQRDKALDFYNQSVTLLRQIGQAKRAETIEARIAGLKEGGLVPPVE